MTDTFDQAKAIAAYTELMRYIDAGAYQERDHTGYAEDGIEKGIASLEEQAAQQGLQFIGSKGNYRLEPMTPKEVMDFQAARIDGVLSVAKDRVTQDMPYVIVGEARTFQYHFKSQRWYVEVDVKHHNEAEGEAIVLCRVWYERRTGFLQAQRVTIV